MRIDALLGDTPKRHPGRIALTDEHRSIMYGSLPSLVQSEAQFLRDNGGNRFALLAENGCAWVLTDLALHHENRVNVPLPTYFTSQQLRLVIDDAGIDALVTDRPEQIAAIAPGFRRWATSPISGLCLMRRRLASEALPALPEATSKITYTSGSTAEPKGVCLASSAADRVSRSLATIMAPLGIRRHLCLLPLPTLLENIAGVYAPLSVGATCSVLPAAASGIAYAGVDPGRLLAVLGEQQPESLILVPELLKLLVRAAQQGKPLPDTLRFIAVGGAHVSHSLLEEAAALRLPVFEGYGLTECASVVCLNTPGATRRGSVGRALPHSRIHCSNSGELIVTGTTMSGYLSERASWRPKEIATGDLGEIDNDGYVYVRGRLRNMFISSLGRNVSPEWLERELTHEPGIRYAIVCGEAQPHAAALVSTAHPDPEGRVTQAAVERANSRLPEHARIHRWKFLPETPSLANGLLTANGRVRRERVLERFGALFDELFAS